MKTETLTKEFVTCVVQTLIKASTVSTTAVVREVLLGEVLLDVRLMSNALTDGGCSTQAFKKYNTLILYPILKAKQTVSLVIKKANFHPGEDGQKTSSILLTPFYKG